MKYQIVAAVGLAIAYTLPSSALQYMWTIANGSELYIKITPEDVDATCIYDLDSQNFRLIKPKSKASIHWNGDGDTNGGCNNQTLKFKIESSTDSWMNFNEEGHATWKHNVEIVNGVYYGKTMMLVTQQAGFICPAKCYNEKSLLIPCNNDWVSQSSLNKDDNLVWTDIQTCVTAKFTKQPSTKVGGLIKGKN